MKRTIRDYLVLALIGGTVIALDQISKYYVRTALPVGEIWSPWPWLAPYARIVHWTNTGVAFGMFQGMGTVFAVLAALVAGVIIYYYPRVPQGEWPLRLALGLQFGGAVGNLIDRIYQGYVTDFISVGNFAVFNVADASITVGVAVLILGVWLQERQQKKDGTPPVDLPAAGDGEVHP